MIKKTIVSILMASMLLCGCESVKSLSDDGKPVAPQSQATDRSQSGDPVLPFLKPWWKD